MSSYTDTDYSHNIVNYSVYAFQENFHTSKLLKVSYGKIFFFFFFFANRVLSKRGQK